MCHFILLVTNGSIHCFVLTQPWMIFAGCDGRGNIVCPTCNANQEPGFYKENQMTECPACYGRGLIAHRDGEHYHEL